MLHNRLKTKETHRPKNHYRHKVHYAEIRRRELKCTRVFTKK